MGRRLFTAEFKRECAELVLKQNYKVKDAAEAMNIGQSTLQRWMRQYREEQLGVTPKAAAITEEHRRIQQLEAQVKQLKRDNDLLNKASAFFAMEMNVSSKSR